MAVLALAAATVASPRAALSIEPDFPARPPIPAPAADEVIADRFTILDAEDARLYRDIFRLQADGKWKAADERIAKLSDRLLLGHVLYQRYMHPRAYRSSYVELKNWMARYADHPDADRIYRLAVKRRPANYLWPRKPGWPAVNVPGARSASEAEWTDDSRPTVRRRCGSTRSPARR